MHGVAPHMCGQVGRPLLDRGAGGRSPGYLANDSHQARRSLPPKIPEPIRRQGAALVIEQRFRTAQSGFLPPHGSPHEATRPARLCFPCKAGLLPTKGASTMRNTVIRLATAAAIITAGSTLNASAHGMSYEGYSGPQGEYGRGEYRREFERREYPRREFRRGEYREFERHGYPRREFERHGYPRREFGGGEYPRREYRRGEYGERGGYGKYRD